MNRNLITQFTRLVEKTKTSTKPADTYRLQIFANALKIIKSFNTEIESGEELAQYPGIGKGIIRRINEIRETKTLKELENGGTHGGTDAGSHGGTDVKSKINKTGTRQELMKVIGIGPSVADNLVESGVTSINDLKKKVKKGSIEVSSAIKTGLKFYGKVQTNIPHQEVTEIYDKIKTIVKIDLLEITICGSYRRQRATSNDIDVLMYHPHYVTRENVENSDILRRVKASLVKHRFLVGHLDHMGKTKYMGFCRYSRNHPVRRIDIRFVPWKSRATALMYFTGSRNFNEMLRKHAKTKNMKLNEYGLYRVMKDSKLKRIETNTEQDVFDVLGKPYLAPHERDL